MLYSAFKKSCFLKAQYIKENTTIKTINYKFNKINHKNTTET